MTDHTNGTRIIEANYSRSQADPNAWDEAFQHERNMQGLS